jgi:hypothetical protein
MVHDIFLFYVEENSWGTRLWHFAPLGPLAYLNNVGVHNLQSFAAL